MAKDFNRHFSKDNIQIENMHVKRWLTSLIIWELQIKTTRRYHFITTRVAKIETKNINCWWGCRAGRTVLHCWWMYKMVQPSWEIVSQFHVKLKIFLPYDPASPLLGIQKKQRYASIKNLNLNVHSSVIHKSPKLETIQMSISRWMDKPIMVNLYNGLLLNNKKEQ